MDYLTASKNFNQAEALMQSGKSFENLDAGLQVGHTAWATAPTLGGFHFVADLPALLIIFLITALVYRGIRESKNATNAMVVIKLGVVLLVIAVGIFYVNTDNWQPFLPNGIPGVLKGVSAVFFAYIGFDAISTTAEECKNPQRDLPRGMMWAIIICTILYVAIALVLTGMVNSADLAVGDPLAFVFAEINLKWMSAVIGVSAIVAMASVLLVFQLGQPRIWMSMSRDGLLPKKFARVHPRFRTPAFATVVTGFVVAIPALFMNLPMVTDLCSIGTLFAFVLVCAGVLKLEMTPGAPRGKFKTPYVNSKFIMPVLFIAAIALNYGYNKDNMQSFLNNTPQMYSSEDFISRLSVNEIETVRGVVAEKDSTGLDASNNDLESYLSSLRHERYASLVQSLPIEEDKKLESGMSLFKHKIPTWIFLIVCVYLLVLAMRKNLSLIPLLGLISCLYMMSEISVTNWIGFTIWLIVGLVIYFGYSYRNSKLSKSAQSI
jgi:basic amino acid/polyamine antiporter, APA family